MTEAILVAMLAFLLGGILKGAIGAGTPVIVIPLMSIYFDVPFAVAVFALPALVSNLWQGWSFRRHLSDRSFVLRLVVAAGIGALLGTLLLAALPSHWLSITVGLLALFYVGFRMAKPDWALNYAFARSLAVPAGLLAGILQGAAGISAPISVTYLHAMQLPRERFIPTISALFAAMALIQLPSLIGVGIMSWQILWLSLLACVPLFLGMPIGAALVRRFGAKAFDRTIMVLLLVIAVMLIAESV
ncbi:sulfite exporter TauE/SafE family protein [Paracoccus xiamenensis]|uniref:sulfite exporter TauE/SafE family protein n=1 Tax=Paracoccus xiamenensis TaxID=2714901 RepID=UPI00140D4788|nr:sulfite exporter TauE/SafE family protein [Paracoccus xiamenensis]NHF74342.1 sulfite exporter TauE/SafE family protein [Paracoccus xiamenensis]